MPDRRHWRTTTTTLVIECLTRADDFMTTPQIVEAVAPLDDAQSPAQQRNRVTAALHAMRKAGAVACLSEGGTLWWYATPETDRRSVQVEQRPPETKPRKPRKPRKRRKPE